MDKESSPPCIKSTLTKCDPKGAVMWQPMPRQPPLFRPHDDFESWQYQVSVYLAAVHPENAGPFLLSFLSEEAAKIACNAGISVRTSSEEILTALRGLFGRSEPCAVWRERLLSRKQLPGEPIDDFLWSIMDLAAKAYPVDQDERRRGTLERFCMGLADQGLRHKFMYQPAPTIDVALAKARQKEQLVATSPSELPVLCLAMEEKNRVSPMQENRSGPQPGCKYCTRFGRLAQYCGHNPPIRREELQGRHKSVPIHCVSSTVCNTTTNVVRLLTSNGLLGSIRVQFLIDTGASCSLVNENIANESGGSIIRSTSRGIFMADGSDLATRGELTARLTVQDRTFDHRFFVCRGLKWDAILGMDFLSAHCQNIQISTGRMSFKEAVVKNQSVQRQSVNATLYACNDREFQTEVIEGIKSNADVTLSQKSALIATLESYRGVFASTEGTPGRTDVIHHEIDTGDHRPIKQRPRRLPIHYVPQLDEMINNMLTPSTTNNETTTEYTRALQKRIYEAFDQVKRNSNCARKQQKRQYDRKVCGPTYAVGDRVLLYRPRPPPGSASKFYRRWQGPYDVVFIRSPTVYVIRRMGGRNGEVLTVHYNHLKPLRRVQSDEQEDLELIPPGCLPIVEDTVEVAPEGGPGVPQRYPGTGDSAIQGREQCNSSEEVPGRFECARL